MERGSRRQHLLAKLGLPADLPPETVLKDIEGIVEGFEITAVRTVVDEALGLAPAAEAKRQQIVANEAAAQAAKLRLPATAAQQREPAAEPTAEPTAAAAADRPRTHRHGDGDG